MLRQKQGLSGAEQLTDDELDMILQLEEEQARRGNFQRVFPVETNVSQFGQFFQVKRYQNQLLAYYLMATEAVRTQLLASKFKRLYHGEV